MASTYLTRTQGSGGRQNNLDYLLLGVKRGSLGSSLSGTHSLMEL
jgi:hypothetical protein